MGPLDESLVAWVLMPLALVAIALGLGLLVARLTRLDVPNALLAPLGLCAAIVVAVPGFRLELGGAVCAAVLVVLAAAGYVASRHELRTRLNPGLAGATALAVFALYLAPVVLSGGWTWTGYNFVNDTAVQLILAEHLGERGTEQPVEALDTPAQKASVSTYTATVHYYLRASYPLGTHALLAGLATLTGADPAAIYSPLIAVIAALTGVALAVLVAPAVRSRALAAGIGFAGMAANLTYAYGMQGNLKEIGMLAALVVSAAVSAQILRAAAPARGSIALGICLAAMLAVFGSAALPYILAVGGTLAVAGLVVWGARGRKILGRMALAGGAALVVAALVAAPSVLESLRVLRETFGAQAAERLTAGGGAPELGQLLRRLPLPEGFGIWLAGDYRAPVPPSRDTLNALAIAVAAASFAAGVIALGVRRQLGPLLLIVPVVAVLLLGSPRVSPYAAGKLLAIAAPALVAGALIGALALRRFTRAGAYALAGLLVGAVLLSDAFLYHDVQLAPVERMKAMRDVSQRYADRGPVMFAELDELAKYFMSDHQMVIVFDSISTMQAVPRGGGSFTNQYFDLDDQDWDFTAWSWVVQRKSPVTSRPPANFELDYENRFYRVWGRRRDVRVAEHVPVQARYSAAGTVPCDRLRALARRARPGDRLVAVVRAPVPQLDTATARRSGGWIPHPFIADTVLATTPGAARARTRVPGGRYRVWIRGSFGRPVEARIDGRAVGRASGVETPGQWQAAGVTSVAGGVRRLELHRDGGGLAPGDGYFGALGPLALEPLVPWRMVRVAPSRYRRLCGRNLDWVERVSPRA